MEMINGKYQLNGLDPINLCEKYGTPLYVYDTSKMESQYNRMKEAFKSVKLKINYACKALTNINVLKVFQQLGAGLDAVSIQEVELGLKAGFKPEDIIFTPNGVSLEEIKEGVKKGVRINIDNISVLEHFGHIYENKVPVCIRVNPHIMAGGHTKISTGHIDSKFGISIYQIPHVVKVVEANNMDIEGLHMHTGSDILDIDAFTRGTEILLDTAKHFSALRFIDFGSGFKVPYKPDDIETDIEKLGVGLTKQFKKFCKEYGRDLMLMFEPGKYLVSEAGYFFVKVNVIKQTTSTVFAGVDSGLNHFIRPMFYDSYHHILNLSNPEGNPRIYSVVGYICETDTFAYNRKIAEISEGDYLAFMNAGAYCSTMASNYNSRYRPAEIMIHKGKDYLIRKRENIEDLTRNQVIHEIEP